MKPLLACLGTMILLLSGCSSSTSSTMDGEALYQKSCAACHGEKLEGRVGPTLVNMKSKYTEEELRKMISDGTPRMPGNLLSEEESGLVTKWLLQK